MDFDSDEYEYENENLVNFEKGENDENSTKYII